MKKRGKTFTNEKRKKKMMMFLARWDLWFLSLFILNTAIIILQITKKEYSKNKTNNFDEEEEQRNTT